MNLSIIIPAYNAEKHVHRCLTSIDEAIDIDDYEVILIDDGSTDQTVEIARKYIQDTKAEYIKIISQMNSRQGAARNKGICIAKGKYIMFVDVDDYLNPIGFKDFFSIAESYHLDIFKFSFKVFDATEHFKINTETQFRENTLYSGLQTILMNYNIGSVCSAIYNREFLIESNIKFRNDIVHEDVDFTLRLMPKVERMMFSSACLYSYCWNEGSTDRNKSTKSIIRSKQSDVIITKSYIDTANSYVNNALNLYYHKKGNSLMISILMSLIRNKEQLSLSERSGIIEYAKKQGVYPLKRLGTLSWKTSLLQLFLNHSIIVSILLRLSNF